MSLWYKIKRGFLRWFGDIQVIPKPLFIIFGSTSYKLNGDETRQILNVLSPGSILIRRHSNYISSRMIKGYFTHAGLYIGNSQVIHMLGDGIEKEDILQFCRCDDMFVINCTNPDMVDEAINRANGLLDRGVEYDYDFNTSDRDEFYCTEFIVHVYDNINVDAGTYVLPDDLKKLVTKYPDNFQIGWKRN